MAKWIGTVITLCVLLVGSVLYVSAIKAQCDRNSQDITEMKSAMREQTQLLRDIDRRQVAIMQQLRVKPPADNNIGD